MRINLHTIILSLAVASSVYAAPTPAAHLDKRGWLADKLKPLFTKAIKSMECGACTAAIKGAKDVAFINKSWVLTAARELCPSLAKMPADVVSQRPFPFLQ